MITPKEMYLCSIDLNTFAYKLECHLISNCQKKKFKILIKTILQRCEGVQCGDNKSDDRYKQGVYCIY